MALLAGIARTRRTILLVMRLLIISQNYQSMFMISIHRIAAIS